MEDWHMPSRPAALPAAQKVLALAPHPDDEVFGCGGVLALYSRLGAHVHVVVLTDGAAQVDPPDRERHFSARAAESRAAAAWLGVESVDFWGLPDRSLSFYGELTHRIAQCLIDHRPDVILAPSLWEIHPDHLAVGKSVMQALRSHESLNAEVLLYEVGASQRVNLLVDITAVWDAKSRAMACFASQQERQDYARHIEGLNAWRTYTLPRDCRYAEGLTRLTCEQLQDQTTAELDVASLFLRLIHDSVLIEAESAHEAMRRQVAAQEAALRDSLHEFHGVMAVRDETIKELQGQVRQREEAIAPLREELQRCQMLLAESRHALVLSQEIANQLQGYLDDLQRSHSWRATAPLRWMATQLRRIRRA